MDDVPVLCGECSRGLWCRTCQGPIRAEEPCGGLHLDGHCQAFHAACVPAGWRLSWGRAGREERDGDARTTRTPVPEYVFALLAILAIVVLAAVLAYLRP